MFKFGTILKPVGLKGEVRIYSDSDFINKRLKKGSVFYVDGKILTIEKSIVGDRVHKVKFKELNSIEEAQMLRNKVLMLKQLDSSLLADDEYYHSDLLECEVYFESEYLGKVTEILETGAHQVLRVQKDDSSFLVPFTKLFVPVVDILSKRIEVHLIEGML